MRGISGVGCSLADYIYSNIDFSADRFRKYLSTKASDGGLEPGKLVFLDDFQSFGASHGIEDIVGDINRDYGPPTFNLGGPAIVALVNAAQLLHNRNVLVKFYGMVGNDSIGNDIISTVSTTPVNIANYKVSNGVSPFTYVLSDPFYDNGSGERTFISNLGVARDYHPMALSGDFFDSEIVVFAATALLPNIHNDLSGLLKRGKKNGCINVVTTVFDLINDKKNQKKWPMVNTDEEFKNIDLLIANHQEALKISGRLIPEDSIRFFIQAGVSALIITDGTRPVHIYSDGRLFKKQDVAQLPVSESSLRDLAGRVDPKGDTTGCGDNFAGGVIASLAAQLENRPLGEVDMVPAIAWGIVSGGYARFYLGGIFRQSVEGEKLNRLWEHYCNYIKQISERYALSTEAMLNGGLHP